MGTAISRATLLVLALWTSSGAQAAPLASVVLVTVDTLRADHLGVYGAAHPPTPSLDAVAADAVVFDRAHSTAPATAPSVATMMTGLHRAAHGVARNGKSLPGDVTTLAETLRAAGFRTAAVVGNQLLHRTGYEQGFERFALAAPDTRRPELFRDTPLLKAAGRRLRELRGERFFLWLHMMAPHGPYQPPPRYLAALPAALFRRPQDRILMVSMRDRGLALLPRYQHLGGPAVPAEYRRRYAAEIRYVDDLLGVLVAQLRRMGAWDDTLLVLTADHGESLGEHDLWFQHGWYVYDDTVRVPLVVRAPGRLPARRVGASVSLVDLMPTVLDLLGVPPPDGIEGASLAPLMEGPATDRPAWVQGVYENDPTALALGRWKYVVRGAAAARDELYDVAVDPGETRNLAATHPEVARSLAARTSDWLHAQRARAESVRRRRVPAPVPPEKQEALRALGYAD